MKIISARFSLQVDVQYFYGTCFAVICLLFEHFRRVSLFSLLPRVAALFKASNCPLFAGTEPLAFGHELDPTRTDQAADIG